MAAWKLPRHICRSGSAPVGAGPPSTASTMSERRRSSSDAPRDSKSKMRTLVGVRAGMRVGVGVRARMRVGVGVRARMRVGVGVRAGRRCASRLRLGLGLG